MTLQKLAVSALLVLVLLAALTHWRASAREATTNLEFPPEGQFVTLDGRRIHYVMRGSGPDLVLIHGASGSLREFTFALVERLAADYRVIAFDRPGHGHSEPIPDTTVSGQARVLKAAAAELGAPNPIVLGQSYGGSVALAWALDGGPKALVLVSAPSLPWPGTLDTWYRATASLPGRLTLVPLAAAFVPQSYVSRATDAVFAPDPVPPGYTASVGTDLTLRRTSLAANAAQVNVLRDDLVAMAPRYPALTLRIELIHGTADTIVPLTIHSGPLAKMLPNANLTVIPDAGHMPHHAYADAAIDAITRAALH